MASKFNIAVITHCPEIVALKAAFEEFAGDERFVVRGVEIVNNTIYADMCVDTEISVPKLERDQKVIESQSVVKTKAYPFRIEHRPDGSGVLQTYAAGESAFKLFEAFFAECVNDDAPMTLQQITIDPIPLFEQIFERTKTKVKNRKQQDVEVVAKITRAKFTNYEAKGDVSGVFSARFKDSGEAREFIEAFIGNLKSMTVEYGHGKGKVRVTYGTTAGFSISAGLDVGEESPRWMLEELVTVPAATTEESEA